MPCKHMIALENQDLSFHYPYQYDRSPPVEKKTYSQNWSLYNQAQVQEFELFDKYLHELLSDVEEPEQHMGRPRLSLKDQIFCSVIKVYSQLSSRRARYLYHGATERQQIPHAPHFNVVSKALNKEQLTPILHELVRLSAVPISSIEKDVAVDSSGFRCSSFGNYCEEKHESKRIRNWLKVHICTGINTNIVTDVIITDENAGDSPQFKNLIVNTARHFEIKEVSADKAYSSRKNLDLVYTLGGKPYIPFKKDATATPKGSKIWNKSYYYFQFHREEFLEHYHKRSNVESTFAAIKKKFGETLKSKNRTAQVNEMLCKILAYNITVLIRVIIEQGVDHEFFNLKKESSIDGDVELGWRD